MEVSSGCCLAHFRIGAYLESVWNQIWTILASALKNNELVLSQAVAPNQP